MFRFEHHLTTIIDLGGVVRAPLTEPFQVLVIEL
jgi:hypothetical protein